MQRFMVLLFGGAFWLVSMPSLAAPPVLKCVVKGVTVYQQTPCDNGSAVNLSGAGKADPISSSAMQARREVAEYKHQQRVDAAIAEGKVIQGMTKDEVVRSWGGPSKINRTDTRGGSSDQWVYRRDGIGRDSYVYVENGVVRSVQTSE